MSNNLSITDQKDYILCSYSGGFELKQLVAAARFMHEYCVRNDHKRVLVDITASQGHLDVMDRYRHAKEMAGFWNSAVPVAVFGRKEQELPDHFWEVVTLNSGLRTRVFTDMDEAVQWITGTL